VSPNVPSRARTVELPHAVRSNRSYPVQLDLCYKVVRDGQPVEHGNGRTRQFSSSEVVVFAADHPLPIGAVELALDWPFLLDGVCPLQVVVFGQVLPSSDQAVTVKIERHEFRTRRLPAKPQSANRPESHVRSLGA
jgi:hypothetical protein